MSNWIRRQLKQEEGLTLIELIVVVAIIAILAFTITPRVLESLNNSRTNSARSVANELHSALERFYVNAGAGGTASYPQPNPAAAAVATFDELRAAIVSVLGTSNTNTNVIGGFEYVAYSVANPTVSTERINLNTAPVPTTVLSYCFILTATDRDATTFSVRPSGLATPAVTCP